MPSGQKKRAGGGSPLDPSEEASQDRQDAPAADAAVTETAQLIADADIRTPPNPYITEFYTASQKAYGISSVAIPASVGSIDVAFFQLLPNLAVITVEDGNAGFSSFNGMLFDSSLASLLLCPGGMEGNAVLPPSLASVPAYVFSRCTKLSAIDFPLGSTATSAFACQDGLLYTADKATLVAVPPAVAAGTALAPECTSVAAGALPASAALPASGTVIEPDAGTGFAYRVLPDGTLEAIWQGKGVSDVVALPESVVIHGLQLPVTRISPEGEW